MAGPSNRARPTIEYWDVSEKRHRVWEATQDWEKDDQCKESHTYPDYIVHAIDLERTILSRDKLELQEEIARLEKCLRSAHREIDWLRALPSPKKSDPKNWVNIKGSLSQGQANQPQKGLGRFPQK